MAVESLGLTDAAAGLLFAKFSADIGAVNAAKTTQREHRKLRNTAKESLRSRIQKLYAELKQGLPDNDPRWFEFGFKVPADLSVPRRPNVFAVNPGSAGHLVASWQMPTGATRIRIFQQIVGVDAEFVHIDTTSELQKELSGFASGAHVKLYITAANAAGESVPSQTVEVVVP